MKVGVKYCGGCNVSYDRGEMVGKLRTEFPGVEFVNAEDEVGRNPDLVLVVCGCDSVCAAHGHLAGRRGKIPVASAKDFDRVREFLKNADRQCVAKKDHVK